MANRQEHQHDEHDHGHGHRHHHGHSHGHGHHHPVPTSGSAFAIAIALNTVFVVVEFGYGFAANSTALMADAGHNLSDVLGLVLSWGAVVLSRKAPDTRFTYGLRSSSILAALANAVFLLLACGAIALEAVQRFASPHPIEGTTVIVVATIGIVINGISAWLFASGSKGDMNIRGAYLHMAADAAVSLGVVVAAIVILYTGWMWLDPLISLVIVGLIVAGTWGLLRDSIKLSLSAVPQNIDIEAVRTYLLQLPGVQSIHDLHVWGISTTESALTVHLVTPEGYPGDATMDEIMGTLKQRFSISHSTLQVELGTTAHQCALLHA